jgi:hypothetical protein
MGHDRQSPVEEEAKTEEAKTEDLPVPEPEAKTEEAGLRDDSGGIRVALNQPVPVARVQKAEERRRAIADETTYVGPPAPTSSSD